MFDIIQEDNQYISIYSENSVYSFPVYPKGKEQPTELIQISSSCLLDRLKSEGGTEARHLLGQCHKNSLILFDKLKQEGYTPVLCIGVNNKAGSEESLKDAFTNVKNVHQWVRVDSYIVEICSESIDSFGYMYISNTKPSNYTCYLEITPEEFKSLSVTEIREENIETVTSELESKNL